MIWERARFSSLHLSQFGDESLVYDEGSGNTYVVDPVAAFVLTQIASRPISTEGIRDAVVQQFKELADMELDSYLESLLRTLSQKRLIRHTHA